MAAETTSSTFLDAVVARLPVAVQPFAKAFVPVVLAAAAAVTDLAISGAETRQLIELFGGVATGLAVRQVPNRQP